jgi:hypothetical protein
MLKFDSGSVGWRNAYLSPDFLAFSECQGKSAGLPGSKGVRTVRELGDPGDETQVSEARPGAPYPFLILGGMG